jgi:hypothetical protein
VGATDSTSHREPWNKGWIVGRKAPFKLKDIWAQRVRLQMDCRVRGFTLFRPVNGTNATRQAPDSRMPAMSCRSPSRRTTSRWSDASK